MASSVVEAQAAAGPSGAAVARGHLLERSTSEQDLSFVVLQNDGASSSSQSIESSHSLPDLTGPHATAIPPSYYQICLTDLFHLKSMQENGSGQPAAQTASQVTGVAPVDAAALCRQMTQEMTNLRNENVRLLDVAMKNDHNLRSILERHQSILGKLTQLTEENGDMRKQKMVLEEKVNAVMNQMKMVESEMEEIKAVNHFLKEENLQAKNSRHAAEDVQEQASNVRQDSGEAPSSVALEASLTHLANRMQLLESRLQTAAQQNADMGYRLNEALQRLAAEERTKMELTDKLNYMSDINQLMQVKLLSIESKVANAFSSASSPMEPFHTSIPPSVMANRLYPDPNIAMSRQASISPSAPSLPNRRPSSEQPESLGSLKPKVTALVSPIKMDRQQSYSGSKYGETSAQASAPSDPQPPAAVVTAAVQPEQAPEQDESHRRHRRHHRIKLFSSRRRH